MMYWLQRILMLGLMAHLTLAAAEPTLDQVYAATRSGHLAEARSMMQEVLSQHPNSAKAHYVDAEVLARSGELGPARNELALAEKLEPGLPFANPASVQELRAELAGRAPTATGSAGAAPESGTPWGWILVLGGLGLLFVILMVRRQAQQNVPAMYGQPGPGYYPPGAAPMGSPMAPMGGGGSGLMGTLATGAALGAGMVAGEALAHRLVDGPEHGSAPAPDAPFANGDLGGQDFGVSDGGSWDSGGGDSGSDWT